MTTAQRTAADRQRTRNGKALAAKLRWFLAQSPYPNELRVMPVTRIQGTDVLRERMESHDGTEYIGRATLTAGANRRWFKRTRTSQRIGMVYTLTKAGARAIAE